VSGTPPGDWGAMKAVFMQAIELPPEEREIFLRRVCGEDAGLRSELDSLLAAHEADGPFLDAPPVAAAARALGAAFDETHVLATGLPPGTRIGHYEVLESLGAGGMGEVYRAHDTKLDRFVALKIVFDSGTGPTVDRVLREARAASALNHPNICTLYEAGELDGRPYLAMEYIAGQPLSSIIPADGFAPEDVVNYGVQIADALAHAHAHGVIHRDLKGANVVVTAQGRAKVLDFGIARRLTAVGAGGGTGTLTEAGRITGTLAYMAPERLRDQPADARSDIWSLGVLLYELSSGRRPFAGDTTFDISSAILKDPPPPLPSKVPAGLRAVILRCLERDPHRRFQRASDVVAALEEHKRPRGVHGFLSPRRVVLALLVAAVLALAFTVYLWRSRGAGTTPGESPVTLGVLPFKVLAGAPDIGFLGIGIPDTIISRVALVRSIKVTGKLVPGTEDDDPLVAGRALKVDYVLSGTVQGDGERIRVTPRLVHVEDGATLWSPPYTLSSTDLLRLQDEIARGVLGALPVQMTSEDRARVDAQYTQNPQAYSRYMRGRAELVRNNEAAVLAAVAAFEDAIKLDKEFVLGHAGLAMASARMRLFFAKEDQVEAWDKRAHAAAQTALRLDRDAAQAHEALAAVFRSAEFDWQAVITEATRALERNPTLDQSHMFLASAFMHLGLLDRASSEARVAMGLNQANVEEPLRVQGMAAMHGGQYDLAVPLLREAREASQLPTEWNLGYAYYNAGHKGEAEAMLRAIRGKSARTQRRAQATLASFLAARGEAGEARQLIATLIAPGSYMDHHVAYSLGAAFAQLDMPEEALRWLTEARRTGFACYPWFERDPLLDRLRQDRAFQAFMEDFKQAWGTTKEQYSQDR